MEFVCFLLTFLLLLVQHILQNLNLIKLLLLVMYDLNLLTLQLVMLDHLGWCQSEYLLSCQLLDQSNLKSQVLWNGRVLVLFQIWLQALRSYLIRKKHLIGLVIVVHHLRHLSELIGDLGWGFTFELELGLDYLIQGQDIVLRLLHQHPQLILLLALLQVEQSKHLLGIIRSISALMSEWFEYRCMFLFLHEWIRVDIYDGVWLQGLLLLHMNLLAHIQHRRELMSSYPLNWWLDAGEVSQSRLFLAYIGDGC